MNNLAAQSGRFFVLGFEGTSLPPSFKALFRKREPAGGILFSRNIKDPKQVKELTSMVQSLSRERKILISVDQEGGRFQRFRPPNFSDYPPACEVKPEAAYALGKKMGYELALLGINMNCAPVLDVNTNPNNPIIGTRSFGEDPKCVAKTASEFVRGMTEAGILPCGKHFPGHGDTDKDSHKTLPVVSHSRERLEKVELYPFRQLIRQKIPFLMTAHVLYPALDENKPATFSSKIMTDLLRKELKYDGLVITDDMGMAGALSQADIPEACIEAFAAGCDLLLVCQHFERHEEIIRKLGEAIEGSPALQKRGEESLKRIRMVQTPYTMSSRRDP